MQITRHGGFGAIESPDGAYLYYAKDRSLASPLWRVAVKGGEEVQILGPIAQGRNFAVTKDGIYYISEDGAVAYGDSWFAKRSHAVRFLDFKTGASRKLATLRQQVSFGLAVSPDGRHLLYAAIGQVRSELRMVDGIR